MKNSSKSSPVMKRLSKRGPDEEAYFGGYGRNRTGVHGFAGRCMTTLPRSPSSQLNCGTIALQAAQVTGLSRNCQFFANGVRGRSGRPRAQVIHRPAGFPP
jgi:hypothetical protein